MRKKKELEDEGWRVLTVWECDLKNEPEATLQQLVSDINETRSK